MLELIITGKRENILIAKRILGEDFEEFIEDNIAEIAIRMSKYINFSWYMIGDISCSSVIEIEDENVIEVCYNEPDKSFYTFSESVPHINKQPILYLKEYGFEYIKKSLCQLITHAIKTKLSCLT